MKLHSFMHASTAMVCAIALHACFTGVESTPRIDASAVQREHAATPVAEASYLADIRPQSPAQWQPGKQFLVADPRISLIFGAPSDSTTNLAGHTVRYIGYDDTRGLMGDENPVLKFVADDGRRFFYNLSNYDRARLDTATVLEVPFTIDLDLVRATDDRIRGKHFYVRTPEWYRADAGRQAVSGLRHIEVVVDSVVAGTPEFAAAVCFHPADNADAGEYILFMSVGRGKGATRTFDSLFAFENPRKRYPEIRDRIWANIICSQVCSGMTRDECRLALGQPTEILRVPTNGGMQERWTYSDGIYLIFDDGFLTRFRR